MYLKTYIKKYHNVNVKKIIRYQCLLLSIYIPFKISLKISEITDTTFIRKISSTIITYVNKCKHAKFTL